MPVLAFQLNDLDDCLQVWADSLQSDLRNYACCIVCNEVGAETINIHAKELLDSMLHTKHHKAEAQAATKFNWDTMFQSHVDLLTSTLQSDVAEMKAKAAQTLCDEQAKIDQSLAQKISALYHNACIIATDEWDKADMHTHSSVICSSMSASKPSPLTCKMKRKKPTSGSPATSTYSTDIETDAKSLSLLVPADISSPSDAMPCSPTFPVQTLEPPHPPSPCLTSTTPIQIAPLVPNMPPTNLASKFTMVLAALTGVQMSLDSQMGQVNKHIDDLLTKLLPTFADPSTIPTSQPWEDYGDFSYPQTSAPDSPNLPVMEWALDTTLPSDIDEQVQINNLFTDLFLHLSVDNHLPVPHDHQCTLDSFPSFMKSFFNKHGWAPTSVPDLSQLLPLISAWEVDLADEDTAITIQSQITFQDFTGGKTFLSHPTEYVAFEPMLCSFCVTHGIDRTQPLTSSERSFLASFLQGKLLALAAALVAPAPAPPQVCFALALLIDVLPPITLSPPQGLPSSGWHLHHHFLHF